MQQGVAVVRYDCDTLEVVRDCRVQGSYAFFGINRKEEVVQLSDADEIRVNLPNMGANFVADLGATLDRGAALDLATVLVGIERTTVRRVSSTQLQGECTGATHTVRGAYVGAFKMRTGTRGRIQTTATLFGADSSASSVSSRLMGSSDGNRVACLQVSAGATSAPADCSAMVRLELVGIAGDGNGRSALPIDSRRETDVDESGAKCGEGFVFSGGKCSRPENVNSFECLPYDAGGCAQQCGRGNAASCFKLAVLYETGTGVSRDHGRAAQFYRKACDRGNATGCFNLGVSYDDGDGVAKDPARAAQLYGQACDAGSAAGCTNLGVMYGKGEGIPRDTTRALGLLQRACDGGAAPGCNNLGVMFLTGDGVAEDLERAVQLYQRACEGGSATACRNLGAMYDKGNKVPRDVARAIQLFERACDAGDAGSCYNLAWKYTLADGVSNNVALEVELYRRACNGGYAAGCGMLGYKYRKGNGVPQSTARAIELYRRACDGGDAPGCFTLAEMYYEGGEGVPRDHVRALELYRRACNGGHAEACEGVEILEH